MEIKKNKKEMMKKEKIILVGLVLVLISIVSIGFATAVPIWSDDTGTNFFTGGNVICSISSSGSSWVVGGVPTDGMNDCYNENGVDINGDTKTSCCPSGYTCNQQTGNCEAGPIQPPPPTATSCADYSQADCGIFPLTEEIKNSIEEQADIKVDGELIRFCDEDYLNDDPNICLYLAECACNWINDVCKETYLVGDPCVDGFDPNNVNNVPRCEYTTNQVENKCNEPEKSILLSWNALFRYLNGTRALDSRNSCQSGFKEFPCPVKSTLPFFGALGFMISILAIGMIYYLIARKKIKFI